MYKINTIVIMLIFTINLSAKMPAVISIDSKSIQSNDFLFFTSDDNNDRYDMCFYFLSERGKVKKNYKVIDNYRISSEIRYYTAHLISGSYQGPDFTYILIETHTDKVVAKLYNVGETNIIIDPFTGSYNPNNNSMDKMDEYFEYNNQNRILILTKRLNIEIYKIIITDLMGKTIYSSDIDQNSYYIDLSNSSDGEYFLTVIAPQTYLMKKITLIK